MVLIIFWLKFKPFVKDIRKVFFLNKFSVLSQVTATPEWLVSVARCVFPNISGSRPKAARPASATPLDPSTFSATCSPDSASAETRWPWNFGLFWVSKYINIYQYQYQPLLLFIFKDVWNESQDMEQSAK